MFEIIYYNEAVLNSYLFRIFQVSGITDTVRLFIPVMVQSLSRIEYQSHYREQLPEMKKFYSGQFRIYCPEKIRDYISRITSGMSARKLFLFQTYIIRTQCPELIEGGVSDIDVKTAGSVSSQKEGAEIGFNKKAKGKPCFQFSASFIGRIFVEGKLFPPQRVFQSWIRAVSRLRRVLKPAGAGEVEILPKARHIWLLQHLLSKTARMKTALNARVSKG